MTLMPLAISDSNQERVLRAEGLQDWTIKEGEPYCWISQKTITIRPTDTFAMFLHEVAHALAPEPEPHGLGTHFHGGAFADAFTRLVDKYMVEIKPIDAPEYYDLRLR